MDTKCRIQVCLVSRIVDGIHKVLDTDFIIAVPDTTGHIIFSEIRTSVIGYIPTTSEILWKTSYIVTVGIHQTEVTVSLQQSCCQLCVRVELAHLGLVGIDVAQGIIRARNHRSAGCHQGESHHQAALTYIFLDYIVHFLTLLYIRTLLKKLIHFFETRTSRSRSNHNSCEMAGNHIPDRDLRCCSWSLGRC